MPGFARPGPRVHASTEQAPFSLVYLGPEWLLGESNQRPRKTERRTDRVSERERERVGEGKREPEKERERERASESMRE